MGSSTDPIRNALGESSLIGISGYFNLTPPSGPSSLADVISAWSGGNPYGLDYLTLLEGLSRGYGGKPLLFTELGYRSVDGAGYTPWNHTTDLAKSQDLGEQDLLYRAFFTVYRDLLSRGTGLAGYGLWGAEVGLPYKWDGYDFFSKPAGASIAQYQNQHLPPGAMVLRMPGPPSTLDAQVYYGYWMIRSSEYPVQPTFSNRLSLIANMTLEQLPPNANVEVAKLGLTTGVIMTVELETNSNGEIHRIAMKTSADGWSYVYQDLTPPLSIPLDQPLTLNLTYDKNNGRLLWNVSQGGSNIATRSYTGVATSLGMDFASLLDYATPRPLQATIYGVEIVMDDRVVLASDMYYHTGYKSIYTLQQNSAYTTFKPT